MKLPLKILLPSPRSDHENQLNRILYQVIEDLSKQLNDLTEGRIFADHSAMTAAPTTGVFRQGDKIRNSAPSELGTAGSKYVITGWVCVASGEPGTFVQMRALTGN